MGMIANYQYLPDNGLEQIKALSNQEDDLLDFAEDSVDTHDILIDIDKMWDVLHFVLTGVSSDEPPADNPLSEAIVGVISAEDMDDYVAVTEKDRVAEILSALKSFNIEEALDKFDMGGVSKEAGLYPNIWDKDDEGLADALLDEIEACYNGLVTFYTMVLEAEGNVVVTIL